MANPSKSKITYKAATREAAIALRHRLQARGIPTGRSGCEIYFFGHTDCGFSYSDWVRLIQRLEFGK